MMSGADSRANTHPAGHGSHSDDGVAVKIELLDSSSLATTRWSYVSQRFQALGYGFGVRTTDAALGRYLDSIFGTFAVDGETANWYSVLDGQKGRYSYAILIGSREVGRTDYPPKVLTYLMWHINQQAIRTGSRSNVVVHAAAAVRDGVAVLMPAAMESGKTTLVSGLLSIGYNYLTDEAAAICPLSKQIEPFPKPLSIDKGSWSVLQHLRPWVDDTIEPFLAKQWYVNPLTIRGVSVASPTPIALVVAPRYVKGSETRAERVGGLEMLMHMLAQTFHFHVSGGRNLTVLGEIAARVPCYNLLIGDLDEACGVVDSLLQRSLKD